MARADIFARSGLLILILGSAVDSTSGLITRLLGADAFTAAAYLDEGGYLWNTGIFVWRVRDLLDQMALHTPELADILPLLRQGQTEEFFALTPTLSIDEATLVQAAQVQTVSPDGYEWGPDGVYKGDPVWDIITLLAKKDAPAEPLLSSYMYMSVLSHATLEQALSFVLANRLADSTLLPTQLMEIFNSVRLFLFTHGQLD